MAVFGVCLCSGTGSHPQPPSSSSLEEQSLEVPLAPLGQVWQAVGAFPSRRPSAFLLPISLCLALQMMVFRCRARVVLQAPWWPRGRDLVLDEPSLVCTGRGAAEIEGKEDPALQYLALQLSSHGNKNDRVAANSNSNTKAHLSRSLRTETDVGKGELLRGMDLG